MSYCVNCGVKLGQTLTICPLCHTPVINPNDPLSIYARSQAPYFAEKTGDAPQAAHSDAGIWLTTVFASVALSCLILNLTVFQGIRWSLPVVGSCVLLWVFFCPKLLYAKFPFSLSLILDGGCILAYEYFLIHLTDNDRWFFALALPITLLVFACVAIYLLLYKLVSKAVLPTALYFFIEAGCLNVGIELLIDRFLGLPLRPGWSAIVFSVCAVISVALITILSLAGLRSKVRKRLHF